MGDSCEGDIAGLLGEGTVWGRFELEGQNKDVLSAGAPGELQS